MIILICLVLCVPVAVALLAIGVVTLHVVRYPPETWSGLAEPYID